MAIAELYDRASSLLERRFLKNAFLPVAVLPLIISWPYLMHSNRLDRLAGWWEGLSTAAKVVIGLVYFVATWFFAAIVASQWRNIIRLFEGYPIARTALGRLNTAWHARRMAEASQWQLYYQYPHEDELLPTRLGNILRAAERYPYDRYAADPIILWPRLQHVMPESFLRDVEDARATVEFLLVTSLFWAVFGIADFTILTLTGSPLWLASLCLLVGALGSALAYESCLPAATEYGEQIRAGVELHRLHLLAALGLREPRDHDEEKEIWRALTIFIGRAEEEDLEPYRQISAPPGAGT